MTATVTQLSQVRRSLTSVAYEQLEELIVTMQLKPGTAHSEVALTKLTGIGRTPVREALQKLEREGLVEILPRKGIRITEIDYKGQFLRLELTRVLLSLLARTSALRATPEQKQAFAEIAVAYDEIAEHPDLRLFMQFNKTLYNLLCVACHNEHTCRAASLLAGVHRRVCYIHFQQHADIPVFARIRAELARAIEQGDPETAVAIVHRRLDYVESSHKAVIDTGEN